MEIDDFGVGNEEWRRWSEKRERNESVTGMEGNKRCEVGKRNEF